MSHIGRPPADMRCGVERAELASIAGVQAATIHGSWARGDWRVDSDLALLIVGDDVSEDAKNAVRRVGRAIGREVDLRLVSPAELRAQVAQRHRPDD